MNPTVLAIQTDIQELVKPYRMKTAVKDRPRTPAPYLQEHRNATPATDQIRAYYGFYYPQNPFLTEYDVEKICKDYGLAVGFLPHYAGEIPERNQRQVQAFHLRDEEAIDKHLVIDRSMLIEDAEVLRTKGYEGYIHQLIRDGRLPARFEPMYDRIYWGEDYPVSHFRANYWGRGLDMSKSYFPLTEDVFVFSVPKSKAELMAEREPLIVSNKSYYPTDFLEGATPPTKPNKLYLGMQVSTFDVMGVDTWGYYTGDRSFQAIRGRGELRQFAERNPRMTTEQLVYVELDQHLVQYQVRTDTRHEGGEWDVFTHSDHDLRFPNDYMGHKLGELYNMAMEGRLDRQIPAHKIIAPEDHFIEGLDLVRGYRLKMSPDGFRWRGGGEDPIILQPVPYGYLILTQWGDDVPMTNTNPSAN